MYHVGTGEYVNEDIPIRLLINERTHISIHIEDKYNLTKVFPHANLNYTFVSITDT